MGEKPKRLKEMAANGKEKNDVSRYTARGSTLRMRIPNLVNNTADPKSYASLDSSGSKLKGIPSVKYLQALGFWLTEMMAISHNTAW